VIETAAGLRRSFPIITVAVTSLGFALVQLDGSILNIALSQIGISLETGMNDLQWTVDAYFVTFAVLLLSAGSLSDRWGARRAFVAGFLVFSAASLACGAAPNAVALIAARAMQGAGAALLVPCSLALLNGACGSDSGMRARAVGLWTAVGGIGIAAGPIGFGNRLHNLRNIGIGLTGMRERLHQFGGRLEIDSSPRGTTVCVTVPLAATRQAPLEILPLAASESARAEKA
jgi:MFS family permease